MTTTTTMQTEPMTILTGIHVYSRELHLYGAISRETTDVIEIEEGVTAAFEDRQGNKTALTGPATVVADYRFIDEEDGETIQVGVLRQICLGTTDAEEGPVMRPMNAGVRKVLRDLAVNGRHEAKCIGTLVATTLPDDWSKIEPAPYCGCYTIKTQGGFIPLTPPGWVAVDISNPSLPSARTSWAILREEDSRTVYDPRYDPDSAQFRA